MSADPIICRAEREDRATSIAKWVVGLTVLLGAAVIAGPWTGLLPRWLPPGAGILGAVLIVSGLVLVAFTTDLVSAALRCSAASLALLGLATWVGLHYLSIDHCQAHIPVMTGVHIDNEVNLLTEQVQCTYRTSDGSYHHHTRIWTLLS